MTYQSLYRRYRPQRFSEVRGQAHLVAALQNAVREGRFGHAYLFSGPRGTGKTTMARILAKALNCPEVDGGEPCGRCESCLAIQAGTSFDVHELDAASNNKVEDIRDLISKAALGTPGRTKVYILDEVHMLTPAASNALLKTLEEPPDHVVFVLATTDPQKVLPTVRSRTQQFEVHLLSAVELTELAEFIIDDAGLEVPEGTVEYVVNAGAGSARDMESALDQVAAAGGLPDGGELLHELVDALAERDTGRALIAVDRSIQAGRAPRALGEALIGRLRDVFLATMKADLDRLPDHVQARVTEQAVKLGPRRATRALETLGEAFVGIQDAPDPRISLEIALVRITMPEADISPSALLERIENLERGVPGATAPTAGTTGGPTAITASGQQAPAERARRTPATEGPPDRKPGVSRPADLAREAISQTKGQRASTARGTPKPKGKTNRAPVRSTTTEEPSDPGSTTPAGAPSSNDTASVGSLPTRDELTLAWGDSILAGLKGKAKARFGSGRWIGVDTAAVFALPNPTHRDRCEECRSDVEAALSAHFGRPVPVRLTVEEEDAHPETGQPSGDQGTPPEDDAVDLSGLVDATDTGATTLARITDAFPGSELVEGE